MESISLTRRASTALGETAAVPAFPGTPNIAFLARTLEGRAGTDQRGAAVTETAAVLAYVVAAGMEVLFDANAVLVHGTGGRKSGSEC